MGGGAPEPASNHAWDQSTSHSPWAAPNCDHHPHVNAADASWHNSAKSADSPKASRKHPRPHNYTGPAEGPLPGSKWSNTRNDTSARVPPAHHTSKAQNRKLLHQQHNGSANRADAPAPFGDGKLGDADSPMSAQHEHSSPTEAPMADCSENKTAFNADAPMSHQQERTHDADAPAPHHAHNNATAWAASPGHKDAHNTTAATLASAPPHRY